MVWGAIAGAAAPIIGGLIGADKSSGARDAASKMYEEAMNTIKNLKIPDIDKQKLILELPQVMGEYQSRLEQEGGTLGPSAMQGLQTDEQLKSRQRKALDQLSTISEQGMTAAEKGELRQARREAAGMDQARQASVLQEMASRGMSGGGSELIAKLKSGQAAADRASVGSDQIMSMAQRRALEAMSGSGNLATQLRTQEFNEGSQKAQAADIISRFNFENAQDMSRRNLERQNQDSLRGLTEKQRIAEMQTALRNQQQGFNKGLLQQQYENEAKKAAMLSGAQQGMGQFQSGEASRIGSQWAGIGQGIGQGIAAVGASQNASEQQLSDNAYRNNYLNVLRGKAGIPQQVEMPSNLPAVKGSLRELDQHSSLRRGTVKPI